MKAHRNCKRYLPKAKLRKKKQENFVKHKEKSDDLLCDINLPYNSVNARQLGIKEM